jgi:hypothetical protein
MSRQRLVTWADVHFPSDGDSMACLFRRSHNSRCRGSCMLWVPREPLPAEIRRNIPASLAVSATMMTIAFVRVVVWCRCQQKTLRLFSDFFKRFSRGSHTSTSFRPRRTSIVTSRRRTDLNTNQNGGSYHRGQSSAFTKRSKSLKSTTPGGNGRPNNSEIAKKKLLFRASSWMK